MEYVWTFLLISWWEGEHMRIDTIKAADEAACGVDRARWELILKEQAERSEGSFVYAVGDCQLTEVSPSSS